jgi:hypothetical protein
MPVLPALGRLRQKDHKFKAILGYIARPCFKKNRSRKEMSKERVL